MADAPDAPDAPDHGGGHFGLKSTLGKKVGPLPMGVWLLAIAGGLLVAVFIRRRSVATPTDTQPSTDTQPGAGNLGGAAPGTDGTNNTRPTTLEDWYRLGVDTMTALSLGYDTGLVDRALRKYITGEALTTAEQAVVSIVIRLIGPPPVPVPLPPPGGGDTGGGGGTGDGGGEVPVPVPDTPGTVWDSGDSSTWVPDRELSDGVPPPPQGPFITPEGVKAYVFPMHPTANTVHRWLTGDHSDAEPVGNRIGDNEPAHPSGKPTLTTSERYKDAIKHPGYIPGK